MSTYQVIKPPSLLYKKTLNGNIHKLPISNGKESIIIIIHSNFRVDRVEYPIKNIKSASNVVRR